MLIDQDAIPTFVEDKRGSNSEVRRAIIGQLLEYAAHASATWSADELREFFEDDITTRNLDPLGEIRDLLGSDPEIKPEEFWERVSANLAARRLRLLFVSDSIPDPLARVAEFLNAEMPDIEVLAVEIKRFDGEAGQTLVPRVIGRASESRVSSRSRSPVSRESFLGVFPMIT